MRVSYAWLRELVATKYSLRELTQCLTAGGLEVGLVESVAPAFSKNKILVGQITATVAHPKLPNLQVCTVDIGKRTPRKIVCGAPNAKIGEKVPVALPGAKLTNLVVQPKELHGVLSDGMLCSAAELGLEERSDGLMLFQREAQVGKSVFDYLELADSVLELELTPNRGDCLSMLGVAREVAALSDAKLKYLPSKKVRPRNTTHLPVDLQAAAACPRYVGCAVRNIELAAVTPDWMKERLRRSGLRSRNVVVDVTNYVMLELGQPMHAFDLDKLSGGIVVRQANQHEKLELLDGKLVTLTSNHLVIADHKKAVALAGIMGGKNSEIGDSTRHIYLESAFFPAAEMLGKARVLGLRSDASHRFERGVDPNLQAEAMQRATQLLLSLAGGEAGPITDERAPKFMLRRQKINFSEAEIKRILGVSVPRNRVSVLLEKLGMQVATSPTGWKVTPPSWRSDITAAHDLVEEVARLVGFDNIAAREPVCSVRRGRHLETQIELLQVKQKLVERGYFEAITYSFVDPQIQQIICGHRGLELRNPIADNLAAMRRSLWPGLLESVKKNCNRQRPCIRLFEEGTVFQNTDTGSCEEIHRLGGAASGLLLARQWGSRSREVDFFDLKGDVLALLNMSATARIDFQPCTHPALHPGQSARILLDKQAIGYLGQLHPSHQKVVAIEQPVYLFELELSALAKSQLPHFSKVSRYPAMRRDLAIVVGLEVAAQDVLDAVRATADELLIELELFDIYLGERIEKHEKSFAFALTFQSDFGNLIAGEVDARIDKILKALERQFGAKLRI